MDVLAICASVACMFFSLGILHGSMKKSRKVKKEQTVFSEEKTYFSSVDLLQDRRK